jgi:hypothetical protein
MPGIAGKRGGFPAIAEVFICGSTLKLVIIVTPRPLDLPGLARR